MKLAGLRGHAASPLAAAFALFLCATVTATQNQNGAIPSSHNPVYEELEKVPQKARSRPNPLANDPDAPAAGKKLFQNHCAECHGDEAIGGRKGPSLRAEEVQQSTSGALFWILSNGVVRRGMPVWSKLPEPQRWQIVTYLKSLGTVRDQDASPAAH